MKRFKALALAGGFAVTATALGVTPGYADGQMKVAMITHGQPGDTFWDIIRKGAEAAAKKDNIQLVYYADPTATKEAQLIGNAVQQHVDGIALTIAFPDAEASAIKQAQEAGIPIVGFNAGADDYKKLGVPMYVGQDETIAGAAVGDKLNTEGSKSAICVDQQQGAVQLEERCDGIKKTFKGAFYILYVNGYDMASAKARITAKLQQSPDVDYIVTLGAPFAPTALDAVGDAGSKAKVGTFDLTPRAADLIGQGKLEWAIDQQPYVEGYESVDLIWLNKINGNVVGGGQPVLTGPTFVDKSNIADVAKFAKVGTR